MRTQRLKSIKNDIEVIGSFYRGEGEELTDSLDKVIEVLSVYFLPNPVKCKTWKSRSSYGVKHDIERLIGEYVSNLDVKVACAILGIKPHQLELNTQYYVSLKPQRKLYEKGQDMQEGRYRNVN